MLGRLEEEPPTPAIIDVLVPTTSISPSIVTFEPTMMHVGPFLVPTDSPMTTIVLPQILGRVEALSLRVCLLLHLLPHLYLCCHHLLLAHPCLQRSRRALRGLWLAAPRFAGTPGDKPYDFLSNCLN